MIKKEHTMEARQALEIESKKGDFSFRFYIPTGATWGNAIDASYEILQKISELQAEHLQRMHPEEKKEEDAK